ncbi:MAG: hypothetical protein LBH66_02155 [Oscillospiraceae bacterium]|jgi:hypothetical protein|nr:hypothetical protein [Oscillospiraceae bacterium]
MRIFKACAALVLVLAAIPASASARTNAILAPLPDALPRSGSCEVWIDGERCDTIDTAVNHWRAWTSNPITELTPVALFEMTGPVSVKVRFIGAEITEVVVRPLSLGIVPAIDGDTASFELNAPANVTVEYNAQVKGALHMFAMEPDPEPINPDAEGVIYFGPGVHDARQVVLRGGDTVYLAPGAVLRGQIKGDYVDDVRILGHGIIDGGAFDRWDDTLVPIDLTGCRNVVISGPTILDPSAWTLNAYLCQDVLIEDVKIIGARSNSDGITIQSCERITARNCFVRGWDDNLVVKGYDADARDILFEDCVLWTDLAQSMEIGYETRADVIENISFKDITVLHNFHKPVMSIHNSDNALVRNVLFQNIVVEDAQMGQGDGTPSFIELTTSKSQWSKSETRGNIRDVTFDGVSVISGLDRVIKVLAASKDCTIDDVVFRNLNILGRRVESVKDVKFTRTNKVGENIVFEP